MSDIRSLWLDLEDTVIAPVMDGWAHTWLLRENIARIREFAAEFQPTSVNIFSFAIWNQEELNGFRANCQPRLERELGVLFDLVPTVDDDIIPLACAAKSIGPGAVDFMEASKFWSKHESFRLFVRQHYKTAWKNHQLETEVALFDDAVWPEHFEFPDLHITGTIINIDQPT